MSKQDTIDFANNIMTAFDAAWRIVHQRHRSTSPDFAKRVELLHAAMGQYQRRGKHWDQWPSDPTTFGQFQRAGESSLHCALLFARAIHAAVEVAKVGSVGMPPKPYSALPAESLGKWKLAVTDELESVTLDLSHWGPAAMMRDADLLVRKVGIELENRLSAMPGRKTTIDEDQAHLEAFEAGKWGSVTKYAKSIGKRRDTISYALKRARAKKV